METIINPKPSKAVSQYLARYAEIESTQLKPLQKIYDYVIVIPICNESHDCLHTLFSHSIENVLIVAVVNSPVNKADWQKQNILFINKLIEASHQAIPKSSDCQLLQFHNFNDVLLVDRNSNNKQIKADYGVGLARKIGCDIALKYYTLSCFRSSWIYSTDADVILPTNYFSQSIKGHEEYSAVVLDFEHVSEDAKLKKLQFYYDLKLRYYHAGITGAGTSYDYIPLGSALIVSMQAYAQVRGFPKRNAGEDFYLLNKLAKIQPIKYQPKTLPVVTIKSRFSDRVPFGTGPALRAISRLREIETYSYYHPRCFILLKEWQCYLNACWSQGCLRIEVPLQQNLRGVYVHLKCGKVFAKSKPQIRSHRRWTQFVHQWFDAFKILKTVHYFDKFYS